MFDSISIYAWVFTIGFAVYATIGMAWFGVWVLYAKRMRNLGYVVVDRHMVVAQIKKDLRLTPAGTDDRDDRVSIGR